MEGAKRQPRPPARLLAALLCLSLVPWLGLTWTGGRSAGRLVPRGGRTRRCATRKGIFQSMKGWLKGEPSEQPDDVAAAAQEMFDRYGRDPDLMPRDEKWGDESDDPKYSWNAEARARPLKFRKRRKSWNPFLDSDGKDGLPDWTDVKPLAVSSAGEMMLQTFQQDLTRLQTSMTESIQNPWRLNWERLANPLEHIIDGTNMVWISVGLYREVMGANPRIHKYYCEVINQMRTAAAILAQSDELYEAMRLLKDRDLTETQRRILDRHMLQAWQHGIGIEDDWTNSRDHCKRIQELDYLGHLFSTNLAVEGDTALRLARDPEEVAGLSPRLLEAASQSANLKGEGPSTPETGPWLLQRSRADLGAVLESAEDPKLRREAYEALTDLAAGNMSAASLGHNGWVVARMLELRHTWATKVGYESYADMAFKNRMSSLAQTEQLLSSLKGTALEAARGELAELREFAGREDVEPWDFSFYSARLRRERLQMVEEDLRPYLPINQVLKALFGLLNRLFGIVVEESKPETKPWSEDVVFYRVNGDERQVPVGGFYFDPHKARRKTRGHTGFFAEPLLTFSWATGRRGESRRPVMVIVGEVEDGLLTWQQVLSLFRSMGYAMQEILTNQPEALAAGTRNMELDAVTFPQHFLELWAYEPTTLRSMCAHAETGNPPPDELLQGILDTQWFQGGHWLLGQLREAQLDLELHANYRPGGDETPWDVAKRVEEEFAVLPGAVEEHRPCRMAGPFSTGYAAGSYFELWSRLLAADAFEAFEEAEGSDLDVRRLGELFKVSILEPGGGRSPLEAFKEFRGRSPLVAPLLRRLGVRRG